LAEPSPSAPFLYLTPAARRVLDAVAAIRRYESGQIVMQEGEPDAPVYVVRQGAVRVYRTSLDGREQTLIRLGPGAAFNAPAAIFGGCAGADRPPGRAGQVGAPASVAALTAVELAVISRADFCRTVIQTPELALVVLRDLATKVHHLTDLTRDLGLLTVRARLANFLLSHGPGGGHARWTHHEIASQIGTVREVVSRTMRAFVKDGLVKLERHRIVVLDREALELEAGTWSTKTRGPSWTGWA
jgi:CRP/FNR family transcriptional regulator